MPRIRSSNKCWSQVVGRKNTDAHVALSPSLPAADRHNLQGLQALGSSSSCAASPRVHDASRTRTQQQQGSLPSPSAVSVSGRLPWQNMGCCFHSNEVTGRHTVEQNTIVPQMCQWQRLPVGLSRGQAGVVEINNTYKERFCPWAVPVSFIVRLDKGRSSWFATSCAAFGSCVGLLLL